MAARLARVRAAAAADVSRVRRTMHECARCMRRIIARTARVATPPVALHHALHVACCLLHVACCMLSAACCPLHVVCCMLSVARCTLRVACCMLHVGFCRLRRRTAAALCADLAIAAALREIRDYRVRPPPSPSPSPAVPLVSCPSSTRQPRTRSHLTRSHARTPACANSRRLARGALQAACTGTGALSSMSAKEKLLSSLAPAVEFTT